MLFRSEGMIPYNIAVLDYEIEEERRLMSVSYTHLNEYMNVDELIEHGALIWEAHWNDDGKICEDKFAISQESSCLLYTSRCV